MMVCLSSKWLLLVVVVVVMMGMVIVRAEEEKNKTADFFYEETDKSSDLKTMMMKNDTLIIMMMNGTNITANISPIDGLFSPDMEITSVNENETDIKYDKEEPGIIKKHSVCNWEGALLEDPSSSVSLSGCSGIDMLLTIISEKFQFKRNSYRFVKKEAYRRRRRRRRQKRSAEPERNADGVEERKVDTGDVAYDTAIHQLDAGGSGSSSQVDEKFRQLEEDTKAAWDKLEKSEQFQKWSSTLENETELKNPENFSIPKVNKPPRTKVYKTKTVEICVITDPLVYSSTKDLFGIAREDETIELIFSFIHEILVSAQAFLMHPSISSTGGYRLQLNGLRILKEWGPMKKMGERTKLTNVLHDLANFLKIVNYNWDEGHNTSYDGVILITGNDNYTDGDGFAYIGNVCDVDCPVVSKLKFEDDFLNPNMGRLVAHELGHLLGAYHDDEIDGEDGMNCDPGKHIMTTVVNRTMQSWSSCSRRDIDTTFEEKMKQTQCFFV